MELSMHENNLVNIAGKVREPLRFCGETSGEKFFFTVLSTERLSGNTDNIPVVFPESLIAKRDIVINDVVYIRGQYRSHNEKKDGRTHLKLFVYAMELTDKERTDEKENVIFLNGFICKAPKHRTTPLGREITDVILAVNRLDGKSDYIPCICWGRNAKCAAMIEIGNDLILRGRVQSREYIKKVEGGEEVRTAYEVSVSKIILG